MPNRPNIRRNGPRTKPPGDNTQYLTPRQAAEILNISMYTMYHMIKHKKLPAKRVGNRSWRIPRKEVEAQMNANV